MRRLSTTIVAALLLLALCAPCWARPETVSGRIEAVRGSSIEVDGQTAQITPQSQLKRTNGTSVTQAELTVGVLVEMTYDDSGPRGPEAISIVASVLR